MSSSSSSCDEMRSSTSSSSEEGSSRAGRRKNKTKKKKKESNKKSGLHKSGKNQKLTSLVKYPQMWPHTYLSQSFVSQEKKFEELSVAEFCAGYMAILENEKENGETGIMMHRIAHLKDIMYFATQYKWSSVLNYHAACLLEVERGNHSSSKQEFCSTHPISCVFLSNFQGSSR